MTNQRTEIYEPPFFLPGAHLQTIYPSLFRNSDKCYPIKEVERSKYVTLEMPLAGGHVGFVSFNKDGLYWSEKRVLDFLTVS
jgi:predicted alpha/beta-fold hydrolase